MKKLKIICMAILLTAAAGCESGRASRSALQETPLKTPSYTVKLIPNPQLTPTSREGDKSRYVYSSNIVAVYLNTNGVDASMTNAPAPAGRGGKGQGR